jgi:hypothetical protein
MIEKVRFLVSPVKVSNDSIIKNFSTTGYNSCNLRSKVSTSLRRIKESKTLLFLGQSDADASFISPPGGISPSIQTLFSNFSSISETFKNCRGCEQLGKWL